MNKERRKRLQEVIDQIDSLQEELIGIREDEEECMGNVPENLQGSEWYERMEEACGAMDDAADSLCQVSSDLLDLVEG